MILGYTKLEEGPPYLLAPKLWMKRLVLRVGRGWGRNCEFLVLGSLFRTLWGRSRLYLGCHSETLIVPRESCSVGVRVWRSRISILS